MENENLSRLEQYLQAIAEGTGTEQLPTPQSRLEEIFLAIATGDDSHCPQPQSRLEAYALACVGGGSAATPPETIILVDESGHEVVAVLTDEILELTATSSDVRKGKTAVTADGFSTGTLDA